MISFSSLQRSSQYIAIEGSWHLAVPPYLEESRTGSASNIAEKTGHIVVFAITCPADGVE